MDCRIWQRFPVGRQLAFFAALAVTATMLASAQAPARYLGTVTGISGDTLTVKTDADGERQVQVPATAVLKRIEPGQRDLSAAVSMQFSDLAPGDRVLVRLDTTAAGATPQALQIIAIKEADVVQKQEKEREEWRLHGVGGLVKQVDPAAGVIMLTSGAGATAKTVTVHVGKATVLKRYAPASVRFDMAQVEPMDAIHAGDQLRARGEKNADGTEITAEEVVSGSFRNISGTINSLNAANSSIVVKDLKTKKMVTIHITPEAQMRGLPEATAQMVAMRLKGSTGAGSGAGASSAKRENAGAQEPQRHWPGPGGAPAAAQNGGDLQHMLSGAPAIHFKDLKTGDVVMLVSTEGTTEVTAITLLTGVEPLLQTSEASQNLLSNWSMGSGGEADAAQ